MAKFCLFICFFFKLVSVCVLKKLNEKENRGKSAEDQTFSKSDTYNFHKFLKLIKVGEPTEGPAKILRGALAPSGLPVESPLITSVYFTL